MARRHDAWDLAEQAAYRGCAHNYRLAKNAEVGHHKRLGRLTWLGCDSIANGAAQL